MRATPRRLVLTLALALALPSTLPVLGPSATMQQAVQSKRPIELQDIINWKAIGTTAVSNDGQWFAYRIAPSEGDAQIVVKRTRGGDKELTFEVGEIPTAGAAAGGRGGDGGGVGSASLDFSEDSKFVAFTTYPARREAQRLRRLRRPGAEPRIEQCDDRQSLDGREARVSAHPPVRVLWRCVDVDCPPAAGRSGCGRGWCSRGSRWCGRRCAGARWRSGCYPS